LTTARVPCLASAAARRGAALALLGFASCSTPANHPPADGDHLDGPPAADAGQVTVEGDVALGSIVSKTVDNQWELETEVTVAPNGRDAFAIWMIASLGFRYDLGYALSHDGGATWSAPRRVPAAPDQGVNACVTADADGHFHLVWLEAPKSGRRRVMAASYLESGDAFTVPKEISDPNGPPAVDKPWILAQKDGSLLVAYGSDSGSALFVARSVDRGATWTRAPYAPDGTLRNVVFPCATDRRLHIAYLIPGGVELITSEDFGVTFSAPVRVDAPSDAAAFEPPSCVADGDDVWVAYGSGGGLGSVYLMALLDGVTVAHSTDGGRSVRARVRATDAREGAHYMLPRLARTEAGALALGYYAAPSAGSEGRFRVAFSPRGDAWTARVTAAKPLVVQPRRDAFDSLGDYVGMTGRGQGTGVLVAFADNGAVPGASISHLRIARVLPP
jgi:hypothetical protein